MLRRSRIHSVNVTDRFNTRSFILRLSFQALRRALKELMNRNGRQIRKLKYNLYVRLLVTCLRSKSDTVGTSIGTSMENFDCDGSFCVNPKPHQSSKIDWYTIGKSPVSSDR